ncbi:hypothetical protein IFM89_006213 [Coptis chinensis]|uniref:RING-type domain-containing protein n=1 Tax=Coptis chinensis TaxID=261450 RepID=A0A835HCR3_9MAGN|nr:hypothetical protein IFM89_006213 [Coptis chinensis]
MNNTIDSSAVFTEKMNGVATYIFGVTFGIVFLLIIIAIVSYFCNRGPTLPSPPQQNSSEAQTNNISVAVDIGLDETTIQSYPTLLYSLAKLKNKDTVSYCSICLSDYENTDMLRVLPDCGHLFHEKCVDPWLQLRPTCPLCRKSPIPTPPVIPFDRCSSLGTPS